MFCPGYLERQFHSNLRLVLFIQHILNTISVPYPIHVLSERWLTHLRGVEWWLIHAEWWLFLTSDDQCGQNTDNYMKIVKVKY